jgi:hypothetical protein
MSLSAKKRRGESRVASLGMANLGSSQERMWRGNIMAEEASEGGPRAVLQGGGDE